MDNQHADKGRAVAARLVCSARPSRALLGAVAVCLGVVGAGTVHGTGTGAPAGDAGPSASMGRTDTGPAASRGRPAVEQDLAPAFHADPAQGTETATPTPSSTHATATATPTSPASPTEAPSPSPSPTSYRVADVGVELTCDPCRALPGGVYRYKAHTYNRGPALAPNGVLVVQLDPTAAAGFTGVFTSTTWACHVESPRRARCQAPAVHDSVEVEAAVDRVATGDIAVACVSIGFVSPGGGEDPYPANNQSCIEVTIDGPSDRRVFLPFLHRHARATPIAP